MQPALAAQDALEQTVLAVFADHAIGAVQAGPTTSSVSFTRGSHTGVARYSSDWFALDVALPGNSGRLPSNRRLWSLLEKNRTLAGAKFLIPAGPLTLVARAEFPLADIGSGDIDELRSRTASACTAIATAIATAMGATSLPAEPVLSSGDRGLDESGAWLQERLAETGWQCRAGTGNRLLIDLEVPGSFHQAVIDQRPDAICMFVDALEVEMPTDAACRRALAIFLLRCAGASRMVSAVMASHDDGPRFQILLSPVAQPPLLSHALSSMNVACRLGAGEADLLSQDRALALAYLALQKPAGRQ